MIISPAIIALTLGSVLIALITGYASGIGIQILWWWDIHSGSDRQLSLERKTYLISTVLSYVMAFELASLFLFVYTADHMHGLFIGAMCAAGTLNANDWGYPALVLKTVNFMVCGVWLIVNYLDNRGYDYPLIRFKYRLLLAITLLLMLEVLFQSGYFLELRPDVITSCCGAMFNASAQNLAAGACPPSSPPRGDCVLSERGADAQDRHSVLYKRYAGPWSFPGSASGCWAFPLPQ